MTRIWAEEAGAIDAPLIALIHGTMDRSTGLLRLSRRLDERFRVLRYDRRGYGRSIDASGDAPQRFDMVAQVDDLVGLLAGRRALLIGHSYGGNVAMATAERHPDLVGGVGIYETPLSWQPWWPGTTAGAAAQATDGTPADAAERFMRRMIGDERWDALPERTRATRRAEGPAMVGELLDLQVNVPWHADRVRCPVVLGYGSHGAPHHAQGMRFVESLFPAGKLFVLDDARHDAPASHSQLFATTIVDTLARMAGPPWADVVTPP
jgi:pimeloyl-ACP methyl ester carboxylesterase